MLKKISTTYLSNVQPMKGWPLEEFNQFISLGQGSNEEVAKGHNSNSNVDVAPYLVATLTRVMRQSDQYVIPFLDNAPPRSSHHPPASIKSTTSSPVPMVFFVLLVSN